MRRDLLLVGEMIEASSQAVSLVAQTDLEALIDLEILHNTATELLPGFVQQLQNVVDVLEAENTAGP